MFVTPSCPALCDPRTVTHQAPLFMEFSHWSGEPFPSTGDLPNPGIGPASLALASGFLSTEPPEKPGGVSSVHCKYFAPVCDLSSQLWGFLRQRQFLF